MGKSKEQIGRHCPYCGAMVTYDEYFCRACHKRFNDLNELDAPSRHQPDTYVVALPRLWVSAALSLTGVGPGQFYNGDTLKGITFFLAFLLISFGYITTPYHTQLFFGIWILALIEALYSARRIGRYDRPYGGTSFLLYLMMGMFILIAGLHLYTGIPEIPYLEKIFPLAYLYFG
jgi:hypothetical protein